MINRSSNFIPYTSLVFSNIFFGANLSVYTSLVKDHLPTEILFYLQLCFAVLVFLPFIIFDKRFRLKLDDTKRITIVAVVILFGGLYLTILGTSYTTATDAALITLIGPIFTILIQRAVAKQKQLNSQQKIGIIIAALGVIYLIFREFHTGKSLGNVIICFSVFFISLNTVIIKPLLLRLGINVVMGWYFLIGLVIATPFFLPLVLKFDFSALNSSSYLDIAYAMVVGTIPPSYLLYKGTAKLSPLAPAIFRCFRPLIAMIIAVMRGQETFSWHNILIGLVIFSGLMLTVELLRKWQGTNQSTYNP